MRIFRNFDMIKNNLLNYLKMFMNTLYVEQNQLDITHASILEE